MHDKMMKLSEAPKRLLAVLLAVCLLLCAVNLQSLTAFAAADMGSETLTATVVKTDGSDSVSLVSEGDAVASEWAYDETRRLTITADFTGVDGERKIKIELPVGMCFNKGGYPTEANSQIQTFTYVKSKLPTNYSPADKDPALGGTLTYTIKPAVDKVSLDILISYDEQLWNKENGGSVTGSPDDKTSNYAVPVAVTKTAGNFTETKILSKVTTYTGTDKTKTYYVSYSNDPDIMYDKPLDTAVSMGRQYIYNGRSGSQINSTPNLYWKKVTLIQEAPYKTLHDGTKVHAEYAGIAAVSPTDYTNAETKDHTTTLTWTDNGNFGYGMPSINAKYSFPSGNFQAGDKITYPQPQIRVQGIYGGERDYYTPNTGAAVTFNLSNEGQLVIGRGAGGKSFPASETNTDVAYYLDNFLLSNQGAAASGPQKFTYTFAGKSGVGVTSMRLIMPKQADCKLNENQKVDVTCTVTDKDGIEVPNDTVKIEVTPSLNDTGRDVIVSRNAEMVEKNYYFHTISYEVGTLQPGTLYYASSSPFMSGGAIYGKLIEGSANKPEAGKECLSASLVIESVETGKTTAKYEQMSIKVQDEPRTTTIGLRNTDPLKGNESTTIPAGGTLKVTAQLEASDYPYHSTTFISHPVFYLRLPKELSLVKNSLSTDRVNALPVEQTSVAEIVDGKETGYTLTAINFGNTEVPIGYYGENLNAVNGFQSLTLTFTLQASNTISQTTQYDLRDLVCAADEEVGLSTMNSGWNPCNWTHNPSKEDHFSAGTYRATYKHNADTNATFTVQAAAPMVEFHAAVKDHSGTTDADYSSEMIFIDNSGSIDYRISFQNNQGGTVDGDKFYYLIQLPKKGEAMSGHMTGNTEAPAFDLSLTGPVTLKSEYANLYDVRYSTDISTDPANTDFYNNGKADFSMDGGFASYFTEEEIKKKFEGHELSWDDVRCIKLVVKDKGAENKRVIPNGESCTITLENVSWDVSGAKGDTDFVWSACGLQRYDLKSAASEGHTPTNPVTFHIHPFKIASSVTLTGVKGTSPAGAAKTTTILIPAYINSRTLKIKSVTISDGIHLVSSTEMDSNRNAGIPWGDQNFTLTASLNSGASLDILKENTDVIGTTTKEVVSTLTITLDHANLLSTKSKAGTVTVVIGEDGTDGVEITETITIRTIGTEMDENYPSSVLSQGKNFSDIRTGNDQVKITSDSAVSVQFNLQSYLSANYGKPYITGAFPAGATLILADISNGKQPKYYYYSCSEAKTDSSQIPLSSFVSMNDGISPFISERLPVDAKLLFVVDYAQATVTISGNELPQTLKLVFPGAKDGAQTERSAAAAWVLTPKREFTIAVDTSESGMSMASKGTAALSGSLNSKQLVGNDTCHASDYLTLSLTLYAEDGSTPANFPAGATITANQVKTGTAENKALLTLGKAGANTVLFNILLETAGWGLSPGKYKLQAELYFSRAEGYVSAVSQKPEASMEITLTVTDDPSYGLKVEQTDKVGRLVDSGAILTFKLDYAVPAGSPITYSAALYEKTNGNYSKTATAWTTPPVFNDDGKESCMVSLQVPSTVKKGPTYRIMFRMECDGKAIEVPYNIIIRE
ncbi:hypothetical protein [Zongyangia hominis]|uniref:Uncharacterized protein n=1 Tax=Zongyangia hominis TaxID=2763677 RepID=A0A926E9V6_9FIRM|nr:hypothetical protein [Zongyangia hominis]MBC8570590.1 hypothetical protein [Zongyangia hominis]